VNFGCRWGLGPLFYGARYRFSVVFLARWGICSLVVASLHYRGANGFPFFAALSSDSRAFAAFSRGDVSTLLSLRGTLSRHLGQLSLCHCERRAASLDAVRPRVDSGRGADAAVRTRRLREYAWGLG